MSYTKPRSAERDKGGENELTAWDILTKSLEARRAGVQNLAQTEQ